jgi:hypothetical protein
LLGLGVIACDNLSCFLSSLFHPLSLAGAVEYEVAGLKVSGILLLGRALFLSVVQFKQALKSYLQGTNLLV